MESTRRPSGLVKRKFTKEDVERVNAALERLRKKHKLKFGHERGWRKGASWRAGLSTKWFYYFPVKEGSNYNPALDRLVDLSYQDDPYGITRPATNPGA